MTDLARGDPLTIEEYRLPDQVVVVRLTGELDLAAAPRLESRMRALAQAGRTVVVDIEDLEFVDSAGLRAIFVSHAAFRDENGTMALSRGSGGVRRAIEIAGVAGEPPFVDAELDGSSLREAPAAAGELQRLPARGSPAAAPPDARAQGPGAPAGSPAEVVAALARVLSLAMSCDGARLGTVQVLDQAAGSLRLVAHHGFGRPFLEHFRVVQDDGCACGAAMESGASVWVQDVIASPVFAGTPSLEVMLSAGARAVASLPIVSPRVGLVGMVSIHHETPKDWTGRERRALEALAGRTGELFIP